jgi:hypothetical protein
MEEPRVFRTRRLPERPWGQTTRSDLETHLLILLYDVARHMRTHADQMACEHGLTRAQCCSHQDRSDRVRRKRYKYRRRQARTFKSSTFERLYRCA